MTTRRMWGKPTTFPIMGEESYEDEITVPPAAPIIAFLNTSEGEGVTRDPAAGASAKSGRGASGPWK